ncbi:MAG: phosphoenolpyruvate--protein phosphotransferase [Acidobacteria bacterium]|nr:phosphoenolpyruvate--protein phosphotransferase [Acidobacteriota bacterium]MCA1611279.1 phosphoenolpyruvate--protein phosphotransferase [Acidobacteriota bacterium]
MTSLMQGLPVSRGIAVGRAVIVRFAGLPAFRRAIDPSALEAEERRLRRAARQASEEFLQHSRDSVGEMGSELAAILEAHGLIAADETFLSAIVEHMSRERVNVEWALAAVARDFGERLEKADSAAMRERAADITDVAREVAAHLSPTGGRVMETDLPRGSILIADELSPVNAARLDPRRVRALALERGGKTSHASIIARSFGLPAVVGLAGLCDAISPERPIVVDGDRGTVEPTPSKNRLRQALLQVRDTREKARRLRNRTAGAAATRDGVRIVVRANLELPEEVAALERWHAEGVGLFRSEFLYLKAAPRTPGVEEQRAAYEDLLAAAAPHPVVIRTYDLGGEKGIAPAAGENPALGLRGLRYCLLHAALFDEQLAALCLASARGELKILLPMVTSLSELREARRRLLEVAARLRVTKIPALGVMIEVPSAALLADRLAEEADFFSIGTNDLAQYGLAVDRANPEVSTLYSPLHPAILRMMKFVVEAGAARSRAVAVCGEMASERAGIAALIALGIRELSVTPVAIPGVKETLARVDSGRAEGMLERALGCSEPEEVEKIFGAASEPESRRETAARVRVELPEDARK